MPPGLVSRLHRGVRFNPAEDSWEMFCPDCDRYGRHETYHPLDHDLWDYRKGLARCRACWVDKKRRDERARKRLIPKEVKREQNRRYAEENRHAINLKRNRRRAEARMSSDRTSGLPKHLDLGGTG